MFESILSDFEKTLVTVKCCKVPSTFNILAISFPKKVVSDPYCLSAFASIEIGPVWIVKKCGFLCDTNCVCAVASVSFSGLNVCYDCQLYDGSSGNYVSHQKYCHSVDGM